MSFPRYPAYKDSGVPWLGEVPEHWEVQRIKWVARINCDSLGDDADPDLAILYLDIGGVDSLGRVLELKSMTVRDAPSRARRRVLPDDVLVSTVRTYLKAISRFADPPPNLVASTGFASLRAMKLVTNPNFLFWIMRSDPLLNAIIAHSDGVSYPAIAPTRLGVLELCVPSLAEQTQIAAFLDFETARIDALIAEQERLMELLREKRQAVISHAVTRGLDPNVPMKDSGVPWLGEVPAHWEVKPLMRLTQPGRPIMYGIVLPGPDVEHGVPILKGGNVRPEKLNLASMARTTTELELPYARARLREGDLVYSIRGTIGDCESVPRELEGCNITQDVARIAVAQHADPNWIRWSLLATPVREGLACRSLGAAVRGINIFDLKRARLPVPPLEEQKQISTSVAAMVEELEQILLQSGTSVTLLQERRAALIAAAVTGQIDVRGWRPPEGA